jgi:septal ring factor EnvC (AmiA/AmiB activator)
LIALALQVMAPAVAAQSGVAGDALERQLAASRATLERARVRAESAERRSETAAREAARLRSAADADRYAAAALAARIQAAEAAVAASAARVRLADGLRARQLRELRQRQAPLLDLLARLQLLVRRPPASLLAEPGTATELVHARAMVSTLLPLVRRRTAALRAELAESRRLAAVQMAARDRLLTDQRDLASRRSELARSERNRRSQAARLGARSGLEADMAEALAARASDLDEMMADIATQGATRDRLARLPGPMPRPGTVRSGAAGLIARIGRSGRPDWRAPVVGDVVEGMGSVDASGRRARGMTIMVRSGAQIVAPAAGRVMFAGPFRSFGQVAIIDHGDGWTSLITGMVAQQVRVGDTVVAGSPIGRAGAGNPRIGVELRRNGQPTDLGVLL